MWLPIHPVTNHPQPNDESCKLFTPFCCKMQTFQILSYLLTTKQKCLTLEHILMHTCIYRHIDLCFVVNSQLVRLRYKMCLKCGHDFILWLKLFWKLRHNQFRSVRLSYCIIKIGQWTWYSWATVWLRKPSIKIPLNEWSRTRENIMKT